MIKRLISSALFLVVIVVPGLARAQTLSFTAAEFQSRLNKALTEDNGDTIKACKRTGTDFLCTFNDAGFQKSVAAFKELNIANGRFSLKEKMVISTTAGRVAIITYSGDRGDPMNMFHTIGQIGGVLKALNPSIADDDVLRLLNQLGLMRGDSDATIGTPKEAIEAFAEIRCNNQRSASSMTFGCAFIPRF